MSKNDTKKQILKILSNKDVKNLEVNQLETIVNRELKNSDLKKHEIKAYIKSVKEQKMAFTSKIYTGKLIYSESGNGMVIEQDTKIEYSVPVSMVKNIISGSNVWFTISKQGNIMSIDAINNGAVNIAGTEFTSDKKIAGTLFRNEHGVVEFVASNKSYTQPFIITNANSEIVKNAMGEVVVAKLVAIDGMEDCVEIVKSHGKVGLPISEINGLAMQAGIEFDVDKDVEKEVAAIEEEVDYSKINLRNEQGELIDSNGNVLKGVVADFNKPTYTDFRHITFITTDPDTCEDMDDAIATLIDPNGNYVCYAAIADVTEYVKPGTKMWDKAFKQSFTYYTPVGAYPMIPRKLSHGILSLNEGVDRLTIISKTVIDGVSGKVLSGDAYMGVIKSIAKTNYNQVQQIVDNADCQKIVNTYKVKAATEHADAMGQNMHDVAVLNHMGAVAIRKDTVKRNMVKLQGRDEPKFVFNDERTDVIGATNPKRPASTKDVESHMVNANENFARIIIKNKVDSIFRVHGSPSDEKYDALAEFSGAYGGPQNLDYSAASFNKVVKHFENTELSEFVSDFVLRLMTRAGYNNTNHPKNKKGETNYEDKCHFGLQSDAYTHFTSGIRRFPDLIAQTAIKDIISGKKPKYNKDQLFEIAAWCTSREEVIDEADRNAVELCLAILAEKYVGKTVVAKISKIKDDFIVFKTEEGININVPIASVVNEPNFITDKYGSTITPQIGNKIRVGDKFKINVVSADREARTVLGECIHDKTHNKNISEKTKG